jgi:hypothetical protein
MFTTSPMHDRANEAKANQYVVSLSQVELTAIADLSDLSISGIEAGVEREIQVAREHGYALLSVTNWNESLILLFNRS